MSLLLPSLSFLTGRISGQPPIAEVGLGIVYAFLLTLS